MSTRPLTPEEQDEINNLVTECENPERLRVVLAEYLRLRSFTSFCRQRASSLPRSVCNALVHNVPKHNTAAAWAIEAGNGRTDDN